jgi:hypothetical protein
MLVVCILVVIFKPYAQRFRIWRWQKHMGLDKHLRVLDSLTANVNGFQLSRAARAGADSMEYVYGEIAPQSFIALLSLVKPNSSTVFYDLGSGTGKTVLACAMVFDVKKSCGIELFSNLDQAAKQQQQALRTVVTYQQAADKISFICGNFLHTKFEDATLIFISATALFGETWQQLNYRLDCLSPTTIVITTTKPLLSKRFKLVLQTRAEMSWGIVNVYIQAKSR